MIFCVCSKKCVDDILWKISTSDTLNATRIITLYIKKIWCFSIKYHPHILKPYCLSLHAMCERWIMLKLAQMYAYTSLKETLLTMNKHNVPHSMCRRWIMLRTGCCLSSHIHIRTHIHTQMYIYTSLKATLLSMHTYIVQGGEDS